MDKAVMTVRMRGLREDHDYTQKYVAYKIGIDQRTYSVYETGKRSMPVRRLYMLCELYGVSMDYMVGRSSKKNEEMPAERVSRVLIFMAGMEAERVIDEKSETDNQHNDIKQFA